MCPLQGSAHKQGVVGVTVGLCDPLHLEIQSTDIYFPLQQSSPATGPCLVLHCTGRMGQDGPGQEADKKLQPGRPPMACLASLRFPGPHRRWNISSQLARECLPGRLSLTVSCCLRHCFLCNDFFKCYKSQDEFITDNQKHFIFNNFFKS